MTEQEIAQALRARLASTPDARSIVWENAPGAHVDGEYKTPEAPYWLVSQVKTPPERIGLSTSHLHRGRLIVSVMAEEGDKNGHTREAEQQAEKIIAHFPTNLTLTAGDGEVLVIARPYADEGYNDEPYWRVNVHVRWQAIT